MILKIKLLNQQAKIPTRQTPGSVGYDLYASADITLKSVYPQFIPTGLAIELPLGYEAQIRGRSGLAGAGILTHTGTIDCDYRGEIMVVMFNLSGCIMAIQEGDRIAQMVINRVELPELRQVDELTETCRGNDGFGSTGISEVKNEMPKLQRLTYDETQN